MPQLFPMNWMFMSLIFLMIFVMTSTILFFSPTKITKFFCQKLNKSNLKYKW
uniref:ATP synthase F0 subunit 8 n=1 Tax=Ixodes fecialis TaxID=590364 RepID=UPI001FF4A697|nr:ATP synthase F0 subunit 8 [Ixodes fecialis]UOK09777.1 ATP synthase subunit 8 [Ixodes fecialis]